MTQQDCDHDFQQFSIAMLGIRWQCVKPDCNLIAPACFVPIHQTRESAGLYPKTDVDEIIDLLNDHPNWSFVHIG